VVANEIELTAAQALRVSRLSHAKELLMLQGQHAVEKARMTEMALQMVLETVVECRGGDPQAKYELSGDGTAVVLQLETQEEAACQQQ
jgi:hypothetical protein